MLVSASNGRRFLEGVSAGASASLIGGGSLLYLMRRGELVSFGGAPEHDPSWLVWIYDNLGASLPVFAILLLVYCLSLARLRDYLRRDLPVEKIVQMDQLTDTWTTLFFGTGVIWTAIGMRSALIFALGDPDSTLQEGAFAVLKRLVDGGILLALSTTIFGGVGGYLMRVYKSIALGSALQQRYDRAARIDTSRMNETLHRIESHLRHRDRTNGETS